VAGKAAAAPVSHRKVRLLSITTPGSADGTSRHRVVDW
jgi:hypothetical protein